MILYATRIPADPIARSECIRSFVGSLRTLAAPCLGITLGGTPPPELHPPGPPNHPPQGTLDPTPTHPTPPHPPLVPSGWPYQANYYFDDHSKGSYLRGFARSWNSECMAIPRGPTSSQNLNPTNKNAQTESKQKALTVSVGHCTFFCLVAARRRL